MGLVGVPGLKSTGTVIVMHRLSCPVARGIFQDQGYNLCLMHWQADCLPLNHLGSPIKTYILKRENAKSEQMNLVTDFTPSQKLTQTRL